MIRNRKTVYFAAPLFSEMERRRNASLRDLLVEFADVFLPQEDGMLLVDLVERGVPLSIAKRRVFSNDIEAIRKCDALLIVLDGRTVDEGACVELGFAYALRKECWGLKTDVRKLFEYGDNPMIEGALSRLFVQPCELLQYVQNWSRDAILP